MGRSAPIPPHGKFARWLVAWAIITTVLFTVAARGLAGEEFSPPLITTAAPLQPGVTENRVFAELGAHNEQRKSMLHDYIASRTCRRRNTSH